MVGSRAFACVLHRGPRLAVYDRVESPASAVRAVAREAAASAVARTRAAAAGPCALRPARDSAIREPAALCLPEARALSGIAHKLVASAASTAGVATAALSSGGGSGDAGRDESSDERHDAREVDEAPRRLRSLRLTASRPARPRVAQRLGRANPSPARSTSLASSRVAKPRRAAAQLPSHLHNLARRDLGAAGFTGFLPNPTEIDPQGELEVASARAVEQVPAEQAPVEQEAVERAPAAPLALLHDAADALLETAGLPWISTTLPAAAAAPALRVELRVAAPRPVSPLPGASEASAATEIVSVEDGLEGAIEAEVSAELAEEEDPLLAAFFGLPSFTHLSGASEEPRGGASLLLAPPTEQECCLGCGANYALDWLACPECGEISSAARLPEPTTEKPATVKPTAVKPVTRAQVKPKPRPQVSKTRVASPRVVRPTRDPRPQERVESRRMDRGAFWTYVIGGVIIFAIGLFLFGSF